MSAASQTDVPAAKRSKLADNLDPNKCLKNYTKVSDTNYSLEFRREVPGHGLLRFKLNQFIKGEDDEKFVGVALQCLDLDWRQIDDTCIRVFIRAEECKFAANELVDPDYGVMWGTRFFAPQRTGAVSLFCWIEQCDNNIGWNRFREIRYEPGKFGGLDGRFVLQAADGHKYYVHYCMLADCSPMLKRCMDANLDQIADGVPLKLQCSRDVLYVLLELVYLNETVDIRDNNICGMIEQADFLEMFGVVGKLSEIMRQKLKYESFERLFEWFECAAKYDLDKNKLEVEILKQLGVLARDDEKKEELLRDQMKEYVKKNPDKVADLACEGLFGQLK